MTAINSLVNCEYKLMHRYYTNECINKIKTSLKQNNFKTNIETNKKTYLLKHPLRKQNVRVYYT